MIFEAQAEISHPIKDAWDAGFDYVYQNVRYRLDEEIDDFIGNHGYDAQQEYFNKYLKDQGDTDWKTLYESEVGNHQQSIITADAKIAELVKENNVLKEELKKSIKALDYFLGLEETIKNNG